MVEILGQRQQARQEKDRPEAEPLPHLDHRDRRHGEARIAEEVELHAGQRTDRDIEKPEIGMDHESPDQGDDQRGLQSRKIDDDPQKRRAPAHDRERQRNHHSEREHRRDRENAVIERVPDAFQDERIRERAAPIVEPRKARGRQNAVVLEAQIEQPDGGRDEEREEEDQDGPKKGIGDESLAQRHAESAPAMLVVGKKQRRRRFHQRRNPQLLRRAARGSRASQRETGEARSLTSIAC